MFLIKNFNRYKGEIDIFIKRCAKKKTVGFYHKLGIVKFLCKVHLVFKTFYESYYSNFLRKITCLEVVFIKLTKILNSYSVSRNIM